jgi:DNA polymerase III subunit gamma/tau
MEKSYELHTEYRPRTFDEYIGNKPLISGILSVIDRAHAYIFYGPRGCGKTTLARLIACKVGAAEFDIHEINAADKTGVDDAREIISNAGFAPLGGKSKVYIIDECHRLSLQAFDAFLKIMEEPPENCYFILSTTMLEKVPATIKSRFKPYEVKPLDQKESEELIDWVCDEEGIKLLPAVKRAIIENKEGIPREMLVALDMVRNVPNEEDAVALILSAGGNPKVIDLCRGLLDRSDWKRISLILRDIVDEPEGVRYAVLGYMNAVLLKGTNDQAAKVATLFLESFMYSKKCGLTMACYTAVV